jgi:hypothetical protein
MSGPERWARVKTPLLVYVIAAGVYVAMLGSRMDGPTSDDHFAHLADSFLHGQLGVIGNHPPGTNDWACFDTERDDICPSSAFSHTTDSQHWYVSFPPLPAVVLMPFVAIWGTNVRDAIVWALLAGLAPAFLYVLLRDLSERGGSGRSPRENLTLTALFAFGTVFFFVAVQGTVWFAAHVVACVLLPLYLLFALEGRRPLLAGLVLGLVFMTRPTMSLFALVFLVELMRTCRKPDAPPIPSADDAGIGKRLRAFLAGVAWRDVGKKLAPFAAPILVIGGIAMAMNDARWGRPFEFGHRYLIIGWHGRIERWGLVNYHYLSKNLAIFCASLPWLTANDPHVIISRHGLALWFTTPALLLLFFPKKRVDARMVGLYLAAGLICLSDLMYQNSGWIQFGYRFSMDYMVALLALLALGGRPFRGGFHAALVFAIVVNAFGAVTFDRAWQFYDDDASQERVFQPD